jgi:type I restriction enzyme S subunit
MSFDGWVEVKLSDIASIIMGQSPAGSACSVERIGLPLLNGPTEFTERYPVPVQFTNEATKIAPKGSILFCVRGSTTGRMNWADQEYVIGRGLAAISSNVAGCEHFIKGILDLNLNSLLQVATGSTFPNVSKSMLHDLKVLVPPICIRRAIASILSAIDNKIELNSRMNRKLEKMAQSIFKAWFVDFLPFQDGEFVDSDLGRIPKGWRVGTLDECTDFSNGYAFKSKELLDAEENGCYHVFKMGHIKKGGGFNIDGTKSWISRNYCRSLEKYVLQKGDLLMCMTDMKGNVALLGHTAVMCENDKYIVNQRVGLIRANNTMKIEYPFLYCLTNYHDFLESLRGRANSGVQVNLSTAEIKASKFVLAPASINDKFNDAVMPMFQMIFKNQIENQRLMAIRDTILPKLIGGEILIGEEA